MGISSEAEERAAMDKATAQDKQRAEEERPVKAAEEKSAQEQATAEAEAKVKDEQLATQAKEKAAQGEATVGAERDSLAAQLEKHNHEQYSKDEATAEGKKMCISDCDTERKADDKASAAQTSPDEESEFIGDANAAAEDETPIKDNPKQAEKNISVSEPNPAVAMAPVISEKAKEDLIAEADAVKQAECCVIC